MKISTATPGDLGALVELRDNLARWLLLEGIDQWQPGDLPRDRIAHDVSEGLVHIVRRQEGLAAAVTVTWADPVIWSDQADSAGYIHRLMADRRWANNSIGATLLGWAEAHVRESGRTTARLDCVRSNHRLRDYYETAGYTLVGYQDFPDLALARETALYEKALS
jgi:protein-tyrosine phosphatase